MKKIIFGFMVGIVLFSGCKNAGNVITKSEQQTESETTENNIFHITAIDIPCAMKYVNQIALVNNNLLVLSDGKIFSYTEDGWEDISSGNRNIAIYDGDYYCVLDESGQLVLEREPDYADKLPLGSAAVFSNAEMIAAVSKEIPLKQIGSTPYSEYVVAWFENGDLSLFHNGAKWPVTERDDIKKISDQYVLTENGAVYKVVFSDDDKNIVFRSICDADIREISAGWMNGRCIGVRKDGTVALLDGFKEQSIEFPADIEWVESGYNYYVAVNKKGEVIFLSFDEALEAAMKNDLCFENKKALKVTCAYQKIAILFDDFTFRVIDFGGL